MTSSLIYKIADREEWKRANSSGRYDGSPDDRRDGFIHLSTAAQLRATATKHFAGRAMLTLVEFDASALGASLKWEPSRGGALFPHLYGPLDLAHLSSATPLLRDAAGAHILPAPL